MAALFTVKLRTVNCWLPTWIPYFPGEKCYCKKNKGKCKNLPPLNTRSEGASVILLFSCQDRCSPPIKPPLVTAVKSQDQIQKVICSPSILHEHALVVVSGLDRHLHHNIDQRSGLRNLPVQANCSIRCRNLPQVDDEVANGTIARSE